MSTINVKSSKSAASAVNYVLYGSDAKVRSLLLREGRTRASALAVHTADGPATPENFLARAQALARRHGRKVEAFTYVLAFHPDEFDVSDPAAMQKVCEVAKRLTESMHSADYLIAVHSDAKGHHAHAHITVTNHDNLTGKALTRYTSWRHGLHQLNDQIMNEQGLRVLPDPQRPKPSCLQRREDFSAGGFEQRLGDIINDALHDPRSVDRASFEEVLAEQGVRLAVTDRDGWSFKMRRSDNGNSAGRRPALCVPISLRRRRVRSSTRTLSRQHPCLLYRSWRKSRRNSTPSRPHLNLSRNHPTSLSPRRPRLSSSMWRAPRNDTAAECGASSYPKPSKKMRKRWNCEPGETKLPVTVMVTGSSFPRSV